MHVCLMTRSQINYMLPQRVATKEFSKFFKNHAYEESAISIKFYLLS